MHACVVCLTALDKRITLIIIQNRFAPLPVPTLCTLISMDGTSLMKKFTREGSKVRFNNSIISKAAGPCSLTSAGGTITAAARALVQMQMQMLASYTTVVRSRVQLLQYNTH